MHHDLARAVMYQARQCPDEEGAFGEMGACSFSLLCTILQRTMHHDLARAVMYQARQCPDEEGAFGEMGACSFSLLCTILHKPVGCCSV